MPEPDSKKESPLAITVCKGDTEYDTNTRLCVFYHLEVNALPSKEAIVEEQRSYCNGVLLCLQCKESGDLKAALVLV